MRKLAKFQKTLARPVVIEGVGLHSGKKVKVKIQPSGIHSGILFRRSDIPGASPIPAHFDQVVPSDLCTTLGHDERNRISTVEHLMAALHAHEVDNAVIEVDGPEIPILDGSAEPFVKAIGQFGFEEQNAEKNYWLIVRKFEVTENGKSMLLSPSVDGERIFSGSIDFANKVIGKQTYAFDAADIGFAAIQNSRTFCHIRDVDAMRRAGLALGGSLENAVVVTDQSVLNPEGLRSPDEFIRHKLLDCFGDFYLLGHVIIGKIEAVKAGHAFHVKTLKTAMAESKPVLKKVSASSLLSSDETANYVQPPRVAFV